MAAPDFEFLVAGAERQFAEAGKVQNLSFWAFKVLIRARRTDYQNPPVFARNVSTGEPDNFKVGDGFVDYCAWRRYSDFEWLRLRLGQTHPAVVIPPVPEKDSGDSTKDKLSDLVKGNSKSRESAYNNPLVAIRIRRLQLFLDTIYATRELHGSEILKAFCVMEDAEWVNYKQHIDHKMNPATGWDKIKSKSFGFFSKVKNLGTKKAPAFDEITGLGRVRKQQHDLADALYVCARQIANMRRSAHAPWKDPHELDGINLQNAGKPLPPSLAFNGHLVSHADKGSGTVRHVDETNTTAWVDWGEGKIEPVPVGSLLFPPSGICDPAVLAIHQHMTQMESFFSIIGNRKESDNVDKLLDRIWFEASYAEALIEVINAIEAKEQHRVQLLAEAGKAKEPTKRAELEGEANKLGQEFANETTKVMQDYDDFFRPRQKKAYTEIMPQIGPLFSQLLVDDDWEQRLATADASLPLLFDVPDVVLAAEKAPKDINEYRGSSDSQRRRDPFDDPPAAASTNDAAPVPTYKGSPRGPPPKRDEDDAWAPRSTSKAAKSTTPPPVAEFVAGPPPVHDEEPPPPPADEATPPPRPAETDSTLDSSTAALLGTGTSRNLALDAQEEPNWDGDAPPPLPEDNPHDV